MAIDRPSPPTLSDAEPSARAKAQYEFACKARELELDLFWKRSLFFWGFIGAAFLAFANLRDNFALSAVIASFGLVCSVVWTLANRGSKFWYESWEQKVQKSEVQVTGRWFGEAEESKADLAWLQSRRFSVSKLAIALSDYTAALWASLLLSRLALLAIPHRMSPEFRLRAAVGFAAASVVYAAALIFLTRSKREDGNNRFS